MYKKLIFNVIEKNKYENRGDIIKHFNSIVDKLIMHEFVKKIEQ